MPFKKKNVSQQPLDKNLPKINLLDSNSKKASQPEKVKLYLKEHQKTVLFQAKQLELRRSIPIDDETHLISQFGIIADKVGAGKSLASLSLIADNPSLPDVLPFKGYESEENVKYTGNSRLHKLDINVFVAPHGIVQQWQDYIDKYTTLKSFVVNKITNLRQIVNDRNIDGNHDIKTDSNTDNNDSSKTDNNTDNNDSSKINAKSKKKLTGLNIFSAEKSKELKQTDAFKDKKQSEIFRECGKLWKALLNDTTQNGQTFWNQKAEYHNLLNEINSISCDFDKSIDKLDKSLTSLQIYAYQTYQNELELNKHLEILGKAAMTLKSRRSFNASKESRMTSKS
jgi:hypothetical protein